MVSANICLGLKFAMLARFLGRALPGLVGCTIASATMGRTSNTKATMRAIGRSAPAPSDSAGYAW